MTDISFISSQAKELHEIFVTFFYSFATVLLLLGVIIEYFRLPMGAGGGFGGLVTRTIIAAILLSAYPEIANSIADVADSIASRVGDLSSFKQILSTSAGEIKHMTWSLTPLRDTLWVIIVYLGFFALHFSVFFFDAAILYSWILLYVFSPIMIALFILPQTASITGALFRSLFEISAWKIVWGVLGKLLWTSALLNLTQSGHLNFFTVVTFQIILALSLVLTPIVVRSLTSKGIAGLSATLAGTSAAALATPILGPGGLSALATAPFSFAGKSVAKGLTATKAGIKKSFFPDKGKKPNAPGNSSAVPKEPAYLKKIPFPTEPPGWMVKKLDREQSRTSPARSQQASPQMNFQMQQKQEQRTEVRSKLQANTLVNTQTAKQTRPTSIIPQQPTPQPSKVNQTPKIETQKTAQTPQIVKPPPQKPKK